MKRPVIGITLDMEAGSDHYSRFPWYALGRRYADAVIKSGGLPLALPYHIEAVPEYVSLIDGLIITGGNFDVDPALYNDTSIHETVKLKPERTAFESSIFNQFLETRKPILGICGGHQLMNVLLGGTLIQHIPAEVTTVIEHEQPNPRNEVGHSLHITEGTLLHDITGVTSYSVNSSHHQAIKRLGKGFKINAVAPDGVIEGIELTGHPFCLGAQWHPEFLISAHDEKIIKTFIERSK